MNERVKKIFEENIDLIDKNDFESFFNQVTAYDISDVSSILLGSGIDFLSYLDHIPDFCFGNLSIKTINIPSTIEEIGQSAFAECIYLKKIDIPSSVTSIGRSAFARSGLESITIPKTVRFLDNSAFYKCIYLKTASVSAGLSLGTRLFKGCVNLEEVHINEGIDKLPRGMFWECNSLKDLYLPLSLYEISKNVFYNCKNITVHYNGKQSQFKQIITEEPLDSYIEKIICTDGVIV